MTSKLPTIDFSSATAAQNLLVADQNNVTPDDLLTLDNQTVSAAAVNLLKTRQATNPTDSEQLQGEIDAINSGTMPISQVQQIVRSASSSELTNALFTTTYGITEAQFQQGKASGTLGSQYGLTPNEISSMSSAVGSSNSKLIKSLAKAGKSQDSMSSGSGSPAKKIAIGVGPVASEMSLGSFISAIVAAVDSVIMSHTKTDLIDAAAAEMRINDVIKEAKNRISTMKAQAAAQIAQLNNAISQIKAAKVLETVMAIAAYILTVILVIAAAIATVFTFGAAAPTIAGAVIIGAAVIAATSVFFAMQLKDIQSADGLNWMQRAANKKYGNEDDAANAADAAKIRKEKQQYESLLGSIQTIIDVITAVASLGVGTAAVAVKEAAEQTIKAVMKAILDMLMNIVKKLIIELKNVMKVASLVLMVGGGAINSMLMSGQLQDLMSQDSSMMNNYRSKFTSQAIEARYKEMRANPQYASLSDDQLMSYATTEQGLINSGDKVALAELYARRENFEQGKTSSIDVNNLHNGAALGTLNSYKQSALMSRASGDIHQRTVDSVNAYQSAIDEYNQKNQGLIMAITIGAALAGMAGGMGLSGGAKSLEQTESEVMQSVSQSARNFAKKSGDELADGGQSAADSLEKRGLKSPSELAEESSNASAEANIVSSRAADELTDISDKVAMSFEKAAKNAGDEMAAAIKKTARRTFNQVAQEGANASVVIKKATSRAGEMMAEASRRAFIDLKKAASKIKDDFSHVLSSTANPYRRLASRSADEVAKISPGASNEAKLTLTRIGDEAGNESGQAMSTVRTSAAKAGEMMAEASRQAFIDLKKAASKIKDDFSHVLSSTANPYRRLASRSADEVAETSPGASTEAKLTLTRIGDEAGNESGQAMSTVRTSAAKAGDEMADESGNSADAVRKAASRAARIERTTMWVQTTAGLIQSVMSDADEIYKQELNIKTIKNELAINEKQRQFDLMFALEDLATEVLNQLKEDIMEIESRSLESAKLFNTAIASIWKGLEASFNAAGAKKN